MLRVLFLIFVFSQVFSDAPPSQKVRCFTNARLLLDHQLQEGELWTEGGKIVEPREKADEIIDVGGQILAPGFIDLQMNGGFGCDFSRNPERIGEIAALLPVFGVTAFFPTVVSSSPKKYKDVLPQLQPSSFGGRRAANVGIHLEGPFFASTYAGAHRSDFLLSSGQPLDVVYGDLQGVKIITLAPELPDMGPLIKELKEKGIVIAAGHSSASCNEMRAAIQQGVGLSTHLFNAMRAYRHRDPGLIGAILLDPKIPYTLILDGVHLAPETVKLCWKCNPEGLILISDATEVLGLPDGSYQLGDMEIESCKDTIYLAGTQTIAGSKLRLDQAVRNLYEITGCSIPFALEAASLKPALAAGLYPKKGALDVDSDADFLILSEDLHVQATYIGAELVWSIYPSELKIKP